MKAQSAKAEKRGIILVENSLCRLCNTTHYYAYSHNPGVCRSCYLDRGRSHRKQHQKQHLDRMRKWGESVKHERPKWRWAAYQYASVKKRANKRGLDFNLTRDFLQAIAVDYCPVLGFALSYTNHSAKDNSPSLDRIDNSKGYTIDNVIVMSYKANRLKSDATLDELEYVLSWLKKQHETS